ncbi:MAG TPA: hypothetical protein VGD40_17785 [Chryseosolibacter sp.]
MSDGKKEFYDQLVQQSQQKLLSTASRASLLRQKLTAIKQMIARSFDRVSKTQQLLDELKDTINKSQKRK